MPDSFYDIVIVGGGPVGLAFAHSLKKLPFKIALIEKSPISVLSTPPVDGREIALTHLSMNILKKLDVWKYIGEKNVSPIKRAHVIDGTSSYTLEFSSDKKESLACLVPNHLIRKALFRNKPNNVDLITETIVNNIQIKPDRASVHLSNGSILRTSLIVAADGRFSKLRDMMEIGTYSKDCGQVAIVARMKHEETHHQTASECFFYGGTLAVLPISEKKCSVVITVSPDKGNLLMNMKNRDFSDYVQSRLSSQLGNMQLMGKKYTYPLIVKHAHHYVTRRGALIGDACVGMHPVTAHGFNLGLRGQDTLAREIYSAVTLGLDIGMTTTLKSYETTHRQAVLPMFLATNTIVSLYTNDHILARPLRGALLRTANIFPFIKKRITEQLMETS